MKATVKYLIGETHKKSEDFFYIDYSNQRLKVAVGDWASNLIGGHYKDKETALFLNENPDEEYNGGVIGSVLAKKVISSSEETGYNLISLINKKLETKYQELGIKGYRDNRALTFTGYIGHIIANSKGTIITAVGDVRIAVDGKIIAGKTKKIDIHNANLRKNFIEETGNIKESFNHIKPNIISQYKFQNNPGNEFSYPAIDGTETLPKKEIEIKKIKTPKHILIWSDGYEIPDKFIIAGLEKKLQEVYSEDPNRCNKFPHVKSSKDDRTAIEIIIDNWSSFKINYM